MNKKHVCNFPRPPAKGNWKCRFCGQIFRTRREMTAHKRNKHFDVIPGPHNKGGQNWNRGLTKETSPILAATSKKLKEMYKEGKIKPSMKGKHLSENAKSKISLAISKRNELIQGGNGGRKDVKWFKVKNLNNVEFTVRGSWELNVAKRLNELGILWIKNQRIPYIINRVTKQYNPDFYLPLTNEFVEVKGWFKDKDRIKMNYVVEQHADVRIFFIDNSVY